MNPKLSKEVQTVQIPLQEEEEEWTAQPILELCEITKNLLNNSNSSIRVFGQAIYRQQYRVTKGKVNDVKDISDLPDKIQKMLEQC